MIDFAWSRLLTALAAGLLATSLSAAAEQAGTDLKIARFAWLSGQGCGTGPRAVFTVDIAYDGLRPNALLLEIRYRWRKRPAGPWFQRNLPVTNRLTTDKKVQRINLFLPIDTRGGVWDFEVELDPRNRVAERNETNNRARLKGVCGGRKS